MADRAFSKHRVGPEAGAFFSTEAVGLAWIDVPGGPPVPRVRSVGESSIEMQRIQTAAPTAPAAERLGRELAALHAAGASGFGAPPPGAPLDHGWIGDLPMSYGHHTSFAPFWSQERVHDPALAAARRGGLSASDLAEVQRFADAVAEGRVEAGPPEPPSRVHGDLWSGNVLWGADGRAWLIDPAAHGGHRESDLAMLALFGAPHLDRILASYHEVAPLAPGWRDRVALHQVWPLLVHAALFGGGYGSQAMAAIRRARPI